MKREMPPEPSPRIRQGDPGGEERNCVQILPNTFHPFLPSGRALYCIQVSTQPSLRVNHDWSKSVMMPPPLLPMTGLGMNMWCDSDQWYAGGFPEPFPSLIKKHRRRSRPTAKLGIGHCLVWKCSVYLVTRREPPRMPVDPHRGQSREMERTQALAYNIEPLD